MDVCFTVFSALFCYSVHALVIRHADSTSSATVAAEPSCPSIDALCVGTGICDSLPLEGISPHLCVPSTRYPHSLSESVCHCPMCWTRVSNPPPLALTAFQRVPAKVLSTVLLQCACTRHKACRLYQQCHSSCGAFLSCTLCWTRALRQLTVQRNFAIYTYLGISAPVSDVLDEEFISCFNLTVFQIVLVQVLSTVLLQCACARHTACRLYQQCHSSCGAFLSKH